MKTYDYLIIGGGIAGVTAAETIREQDTSGSIAIVSNEAHPLYSRVLLPSYLKKRIPREKVFLRSVEDFFIKRIDLYLDETVRTLDTGRRQVDLESELSFGFTKLLVASGGRVREWGEGQEHGYTYRLQTLDDADRIFKSLQGIKRPFVVGASFIGLEFLEILTINKTPPILLFRDTHFFSRLLDPIGAGLLEENFRSKKIEIVRESEVVEVKDTSGGLHISTKSSDEFDTDGLFLGIGIQRNITFLDQSGITRDQEGIRTNEYLETNIRDIFAAGDVAEYFDERSGRFCVAGNWTNAFLQGKIAGLTMAGTRTKFTAVPSYSITNLGFQITALGETSDGADVVVAFDEERNKYARFFLRQGILVGTALINRFQDKPHLTRLIETKTPIEKYKKDIQNPLFDIHEIPVIE